MLTSGADTVPSFDELLAAAKSRSLPPVEGWDPERCGSIDIRVAANGDWYHEGALIKRFAIAKLFAGILRLEGEAYYLVTPAEKLRIEVDDAPFVATGMEADGEEHPPVSAFAIGFHAGGHERRIVHLDAGFLRRGHQVVRLALQAEDAREQLGDGEALAPA